MVRKSWKGWGVKIASFFFIFITIWWLGLLYSGVQESFQNYLFAATYGLICLWGGGWGLVVSKKWGGFSSTLGRAIIFLSLGLLAQEFGQLIFSFYNIFLKVEVPYPSVADVGFFGSIPFYIFGMFLLARASGVKLSLKILKNKVQAIIIPIAILCFSYMVFLRDYKISLEDPIRTFLDFGYPLGEAIYISLAIITYLLSRNFLGGVMKSRILIFIAAFVVQYIADFNFLYQSSRGTWVNGGYGDYLYFLAYFVMTLGLIQLKNVLNTID